MTVENNSVLYFSSSHPIKTHVNVQSHYIGKKNNQTKRNWLQNPFNRSPMQSYMWYR